jgi:hypothetical protein
MVILLLTTLTLRFLLIYLHNIEEFHQTLNPEPQYNIFQENNIHVLNIIYGQVLSLMKRWPEAEAAFRTAASSAERGGSSAELGQALYCVATALHTQVQCSFFRSIPANSPIFPLKRSQMFKLVNSTGSKTICHEFGWSKDPLLKKKTAQV